MDVANWLTDFEQAAIQAIAEVFPGCSLTGCFFHFGQALYRRIQTEGLTAAYAEADQSFATQARSFSALAFVPLADVQRYYEAILNAPNFDNRLRPFAEYFEVIFVAEELLLKKLLAWRWRYVKITLKSF